MNNHLKAFTVFELLIAMVLTSILISMALVGLSLLEKQQAVYHQGNEKMMTIRQLRDWLKIDQENCQYLIIEGNSLIYEYTNRKVEYKITSEQIIRSISTNQLTDTFSVSTASWETKFLNTDKEQGIIDQINFDLRYGEQSYPILIHKNYSASSLIQLKNEH